MTFVTTPESHPPDLQSPPGAIPGARDRDERSFADEVLQLQLKESDLPDHLQEAFNWQLQDSIQRARVQVLDAQSLIFNQAGLTAEERSNFQASEGLINFLGLPADTSNLDVEKAMQARLFRDLGIPRHLNWNDGFLYLQQKVFKKNLALNPDADKTMQIRQIEVVASF